MKKTFIRYFTIADFEEEEIWLREMNKKGWKLVSMTLPCFYHFESCEAEDVIYRLDYLDREAPEDYMQMLSDFGWEYIDTCAGWLYFRRSAATAASKEEGELFSDDESRVDLVGKIVRTRMLPIALLFFCSVLPNFLRTIDGEFTGHFGYAAQILFCTLFVIYVFMIVHCGIKLKKIRDRFRNE